ncbi:MAG: cob(I)yrinic acid a,c-diamide adenosyltransferase [Nanoarchaeota archaeon]|nr:cob(I)yrinic acid a,c-diamide adenosyltransferase [Nanoarchaeota archaeon]
MKKNLGLVHVYTGNGKGKTTWALGIAMRALGQGLKVSIIQFMKGGAYTGEYISAKNFLSNVNFMQFGKQCVKEQKQMKLQGIDSDAPLFDYIREDIDCGDCRDCFVNDDEQKNLLRMLLTFQKKL